MSYIRGRRARSISNNNENPNTLNNGQAVTAAAAGTGTTQKDQTQQQQQQQQQQDKNNITEKILMEDEGFRMRATVRQEPKKDKYGNILDSEGNINKSRGKVGIMSNPNVKQDGTPMTVEDIKAKQEAEKQEEQKNIRLRNEQQKMLRFEMQGRLDEYKPPDEFVNHPMLQHPNATNKILTANKEAATANPEKTATKVEEGEQVVTTQTTETAVSPASKVTDNNQQQQTQ